MEKLQKEDGVDVLAVKVDDIESKKHLAEIEGAGEFDWPAEVLIFPLSRREEILRDPRYSGCDIKIVHYLRHGEAEHNVASERGCLCEEGVPCPYKLESLTDARLTKIGREQASNNTEATSTMPVQLVLVSPLRRALETAIIAFAETNAGKPTFVANPLLREQWGKHTCDKRSTLSTLVKEFPHVDFSLILHEEDSEWDARFREERRSVAMRAFKSMDFLHERSEKEVAVVGHSSWLLTLFNVILKSEDDHVKGWFANGELRSVVQVYRTKERN